MLDLTFYFFTPKWQSAQDQPFNQPYHSRAWDGILDAERSLFGAEFTDNWDEFFSANPSDESFVDAVQVLGISKFPALVIYDAERQLALFKLEGEEITRNAVRDACVLAWQLKPDDTQPEGYILPNGEKVTSETLLNDGGCPDWVSYLPVFARPVFCNKFGLSKNDGGDEPKIWLWVVLALLVVLIIVKFK